MLKGCIEPGCPNVTRATRCDAHEMQRQQVRNQQRASRYDANWKRIRDAARKAQPYCTQCGATEDLTVDHVAAGTLSAGIQVLCRRCNSAKGARERRG